MASVEEILRLPVLRGVKVVAGEGGLNKQVKAVTVMEVPDVKRWLNGNEFLITSFYCAKDDEQAQCSLLEDLTDTCSCVAVKTGQYLKEIPESMKAIANRYRLPLLEIPYTVSYINVIVSVMDRVFQEQGNDAILEKYVKDIIYENYNDQILMKERGRLFGLEVTNAFITVNLSFRNKYTPTEAERRELYALAGKLKQIFGTAKDIKNCFLISLKKGYLLLIEGDSEETIANLTEHILNEELISNELMMGTSNIFCTVGSAGRGMDGIRNSYSLSYKTMRLGKALYPQHFLWFYRKLSVFCALEDVVTKEGGRIFKETLSKIHNEELLETLNAYFENNSNIGLTAEALFTHRNTVKYRLDRVEEITGLNLKNPDDCFKVYLAILAAKLNELQ